MIDNQKDKKILKTKKKHDGLGQHFIKYLIGIFLASGWTAVILFTTPNLGRPIISGYVLLFILISFFQRARIVLFTGLMVFLCYIFLLSTYSNQKIFHPILDLTFLFLSAGAIALITRNIQKHYANLLTAQNKIKEANSMLEIKVAGRTSELQELSQGLQQKTQERTKALETTRTALTNLLEDSEESKREIEEEKNKTAAIISNFFDPVIVTDNNWRIILLNPAAKKILKLSENDLGKKVNTKNGKFLFENFKNIVKVNYKTEVIEFSKNKHPIIEEVTINPEKDENNMINIDGGKEIIYKVTTSVVKDEKDECFGHMKVFYDMTREKIIDKLKSEFISISAHQLRTPLSAVKWSLQMILNEEMGKIGGEIKKYLTKTYKSNERMINLVNDLLNVSRIEEGRFLYNIEMVSIEDLIEEIISSVSVNIKNKKIKIIYNKKNNLPKTKADFKKLKLSIQNLVDNAIKYSPSNSKINIETKKINDKNKELIEINIKDSGIGINEKDKERIFSKFYRGENAVRLQTEGSGLGLFIVKNIIKAHGGKIWFESKNGEGSTFYIQIPIVSK